MPAPLILLLWACGGLSAYAPPEEKTWQAGDDGASQPDSGPPDSGGTGGEDGGGTDGTGTDGTGTDGTGTDGTDGTGTDTTGTDDGGTDPATDPVPGDLVLSELMINPSAVADEAGEWLEILSLADHPLSLAGMRISDDDVDGTALAGAGTLAPGARAVFCANGDGATNGGISCDATYYYSSSGDGFALANSGDEVVLSTYDGIELDRVSYGSGFAPTAASTGVRAGGLSQAGNDDAAAWCTQVGGLPGGDQGTPGLANSGC